MQQNRMDDTQRISQVTAPTDRIHELEAQIADLKKRWPAHSIPPAMLQQLDDLEEELENELKKD